MEYISSGKIKKDLEEIDMLRGDANKIRNEILKARMTGSSRKSSPKKNVEKEVRIHEERKRKLEEEIRLRTRNLERKLIDISGQRIELRT